MKRLVIILILFTIVNTIYCDFSGLNRGTRALGMGNAFTAMGEINESLFFNPAGTADIEVLNACSSYQNHYGISDLVNLNFTVSYPYQDLTGGFAIQQVNLLDVYSESIYYFNLAWKYEHRFGNFKLGMNTKYFQIDSDEAKTSLDEPLDFDLGMIWEMKSISLGYSNQNIRRNNEVFDHIESSHNLGLAIKWEDLLRYTLDFELSGGEEKIRTGIELWFFNTFAPRLGFDDKYLTMGFGLQSRWWIFDFGMKAHEELGSTYRFGLTIKL